MSEDAEQKLIPVQMFMMNDQPFACWGVDDNDNLVFIHGIDPHFFAMQADVFEPLLQEEDQRQRAATALRLAYSHALETLFALTYATLQAPHCVQGWLVKYEIGDLPAITRKIRDGLPLLTRPPLDEVNWESIVRLLYSDQTDAPIRANITQWYRWFAHDFLDEMRRLEYNQVKHGFRARSTSARIAIQAEESEPSHTLSSEYGMGFAEGVPVAADNKVNFGLQLNRINWMPVHVVQSLRVIASLIHNIKAILCYDLAGESGELLALPADITVEKVLTTTPPDFWSFRLRPQFTVQLSDLVPARRIRRLYRRDEQQQK